MTRISKIVRISIIVTVVAALVFLIFPGWRVSVGIIIGGLVGVGDFLMIVKTMSLLKLAESDSKAMLKFILLFFGKMFLLLAVLGFIVYVLTALRAKLSLFGFIGGLACVPLSIFISAFSKGEK